MWEREVCLAFFGEAAAVVKLGGKASNSLFHLSLVWWLSMS